MTWYQKRGNKYGAKSILYEGKQYHSKREAGYAAELDLLKKAGEIKEWERQIKIPLGVNGCHITNYFIDFKIEHMNGDIEFVEVKGFETDVWRLKWKLFEALAPIMFPGAKLTVVK